MVHYPSFLHHFLHALYDLDADKAVGEHKSEEDAFSFQVVLLVLNRLFPLQFRPLALPLQVARKRLRDSTYETKNKRLVSFGLLISLFPHVWKQFPVFF